ncbi:uncharacterized protein LOC123541060 isoform X2 [Mercenaria mercenaria]|uniref:uncharacterized protein LOC123541060 isoform X2 n=1 Tax=Mercenaria mercenaria TaxID=6596 RepID=UPI00234F5BCC|nr:uncharacterized protein LOC123541060 isoform X2 [Mercenaria mercenaria]
MDLKYTVLTIVFVAVVLAKLPNVKAEKQDKIAGVDTLYENLLNRLEHLEAREKVREKENQELKHRVQALESLAKEQQIEISNLIETVDKQYIVNRQLQDRVLYLENRDKTQDIFQTDFKPQNERSQSVEWFIRKLKKLSTGRLYHEDHGDKKEAQHAVERKYADVQRIRKRQNEINVAFFAYLTNHIENPGVHQIVAFDHVTTNIGNAYNAHAGDFRAPVAGTYVFATTLMAGDKSLTYHFKIMHNAQTVSNIYITNGGTGSQEVVLQLNQGDDVSIHNIDGGKKLYGHGYSTFSGFLLQQDYSNPVAIGK